MLPIDFLATLCSDSTSVSIAVSGKTDEPYGTLIIFSISRYKNICSILRKFNSNFHILFFLAFGIRNLFCVIFLYFLRYILYGGILTCNRSDVWLLWRKKTKWPWTRSKLQNKVSLLSIDSTYMSSTSRRTIYMPRRLPVEYLMCHYTLYLRNL